MRTEKQTSHAVKRLAITVAALSLLLSGLFLTAPSADAIAVEVNGGDDMMMMMDMDDLEYVTATTVRACIETATVQGAEQARDLRAGQTFVGDDDRIYEITTGGGCSFGCLDGFDVNCDGKVGDFCAVELDRSKVSDVNKCLTTLALAAANAAGTGVLS